MVEILGQGTRNVVDCNSCGSTLRFESVDLHPEEGEGMTRYYIHCPLPCGHKLYVTDRVSQHIADQVAAHEEGRRLSEYDV